jgi:radical SAM superfamily enzyme YgiQ (UPF0313 family)
MSFDRPEIIRPPSEADSYYLPLTAGCSNNSCTFCNFYGTKLQIRDVADVKKEIDALSAYLQFGIQTASQPRIVYYIANEWDGRKVFLQDGDALVYPYPQMVEAFEHLNSRFPDLERIAAYATAQDVLRRSQAELEQLKKLKLGILYMGVESGDDAILQQIGKQVNSQQIIEAGRKIKAAGILSSVTVILGLGGVERSQEHALATARILTALDPDYAGALTLTPVPGTPLFEDARQGKLHLISPFQSLQELKTLVENSTFTSCFFSSMHASNYLSIRGKLPESRTRILAQLEQVLAKKDPSLLRPEFLRGL